jgi:integrase/recombinase XerC
MSSKAMKGTTTQPDTIDPNSLRRKDLEDNIKATLELIKQCESKLRLADDPLEKKRYEEKLVGLREHYKNYRQELADILQPHGRGERLPPEMPIGQAIERFLKDLAIGQAERTVRTYTTALNHFRAFLTAASLPPETTPLPKLTADHALDWVRWLDEEEPELSQVTLGTYITAISRFYNYLALEKLLPMPLEEFQRLQQRLKAVRGRVPKRRLPRVPQEEIVERILEAAYALPTGTDERAELRRLRDIAMVEMLRSSGMRVGELVKLRRGDLNYEEHAAVVTGKGGRERVVYFDDRAWRALQTYLAARKDGARGRPLAGFPLLARHDKRAGKRILPLSTNTVREALADLIAAAGVAEHGVTPHSFRHYFATRVLRATHNLAVTQDMLGHASSDTTRIYARLTAEDTRRAHRRAFAPQREIEESKD